MRPILFSEDVIKYEDNGVGVLYDALRCDVFEEHNGVFDMELEYPSDGEWAKHIKDDMQILAKPNDVDAPHAFRIYETDKDLIAGVIYVRATSVTDDLRGNLITDVKVTDATPQMAMNAIKSKLIEPTLFNFVSDIDVRLASEWTRVNPLLAIAGDEDNSILNLWGGDIKRTNDTVYLYSRRGKDKVTTIRPGKNIDGFTMTISNKGIVTKVLPYFTYTPGDVPEYEMVEQHDGTFKKETKKTESDNDVSRPEPVTVTGSVVISPNVDHFAINYYEPVDYSSDDYLREALDAYLDTRLTAIETDAAILDTSKFQDEVQAFILTELNKQASAYFTEQNKGVDSPSIEIKADMIQLSDSEDWSRYKHLERIQVSDTVDVYVKKFDVEVEVTIKSISYDSLAERVLDITAGTTRTSLTKNITKQYEDKARELERYIENMENGVYNNISKAANGKNSRFSGFTEPPDSISREGDLWFRDIGGGEVETYIYNGGGWLPLMSKAQTEAMKQAIADAAALAEETGEKAQKVIDDINNVVEGNGFTTLEDLFASKMSDGEFGTLFFQEAKNIGFVYDVDGVTEAIIMIQDGIPYIQGKNIILDGDTIVNGDFTVTDTMLANDAVINKLKATGLDAKDVTIINLDASSITGGDLEVTENFRITHNGVPVFEVDATTGQVRITNYATKQDLEEISLTPGPAGEDAWNVEIISSNGNIFQASNINTVLEARVYRGGTDVTDSLPESKFSWTRVSEDSLADKNWNDRYFGGTKKVNVTTEDVYRRATFFCKIIE